MGDDKIVCETPTPGKQPTRIDRWKYLAVRKATSLPASVIGIPDRGRLDEGAYADVVVLNLETLQEMEP